MNAQMIERISMSFSFPRRSVGTRWEDTEDAKDFKLHAFCLAFRCGLWAFAVRNPHYEY